MNCIRIHPKPTISRFVCFLSVSMVKSWSCWRQGDDISCSAWFCHSPVCWRTPRCDNFASGQRRYELVCQYQVSLPCCGANGWWSCDALTQTLHSFMQGPLKRLNKPPYERMFGLRLVREDVRNLIHIKSARSVGTSVWGPVCHFMGAPTVAPIVTRLGQQTLLFTHCLSNGGLRYAFRGWNGGPKLHLLHVFCMSHR